MIILNAEEVQAALPMQEAIAAMKQAFAAYSSGKAEVPLRLSLPIAPQEAETLVMPVYVDEPDCQALTIKVVSIFPKNPSHNLPLIHAAVLVMDAETGRPLALLEGSTLTAIRTGAASGAATDLLASKTSKVAAIIGAGVQGRKQLEAVCCIRDIKTVWIFDISKAQADSFLAEMAKNDKFTSDLRIAETPKQAIMNADIICTSTTSDSPVFSDADVKIGSHINAVGAYTPEMQEIPPETVARSLIIVDSRQACLEEAGDLIQPIRSNLIKEGHIHAELGEIALKRVSGRKKVNQITFFKSVGLAVQDALAARVALQNARIQGLGQEVDF